jgi:hypothetical protein
MGGETDRMPYVDPDLLEGQRIASDETSDDILARHEDSLGQAGGMPEMSQHVHPKAVDQPDNNDTPQYKHVFASKEEVNQRLVRGGFTDHTIAFSLKW